MDRTDRATWIVLGRTGDGVAARLSMPTAPSSSGATVAAHRTSRDLGAPSTEARGRAALGVERRRRAGTPSCWRPACASRAATTCGCAMRSSATRALVADRGDRCARPTEWDAASVVEHDRRGAGALRAGRGRRDAAGGPPAALDAAWREFARQRAAIDGIDRSRPPAAAHRRRVRGCADRGGAARRRASVGCRGPRRDPRPTCSASGPPAAARPRSSSDARPARARGARRPGGEPRLAAEAAARAAPRRRARRVDEPLGARRAAASGRSSRCWSTRSSRACSRRTAGRGSPSGCTTVGSGPSTCPAASSPGGGRRPAAERCSCRVSCARRCGPTRAGGSSSRTSPSSSRGCWPRWPATRRWPMPRAAATCTPASSSSGAVATRAEAKVAMLGAMYGATTGESRPARAAPAPHLPARDGASSTTPPASARTAASSRPGSGAPRPPPSRGWHDAQSRASEAEASGVDETRARRWARDRGRFTRNFVVQGTAAEWALAWMADLRARLAALPPVAAADAADRSGPVFARRPHLAFFLHDEVIVHAPAELRRGGRARRCGEAAASAAACCSATSRSTSRSTAHRRDRAQGLTPERGARPGARG